MTEKYFSYDPEDGFEFHTNKEDALKRVEEALDLAYDTAADSGWDITGVDSICWGKIVEKVELISSKPSENPNFDTIDEYKLVPTNVDREEALKRLIDSDLTKEAKKFVGSLKPKEKEVLKKHFGIKDE